jgi:hypothetical protein
MTSLRLGLSRPKRLGKYETLSLGCIGGQRLLSYLGIRNPTRLGASTSSDIYNPLRLKSRNRKVQGERISRERNGNSRDLHDGVGFLQTNKFSSLPPIPLKICQSAHLTASVKRTCKKNKYASRGVFQHSETKKNFVQPPITLKLCQDAPFT